MPETTRVPRGIPWLRTIGAGVLAFLALWAVGIVGTILAIRDTLPAGPAPDDPAKGAGEAGMAVFCFFLGVVPSFFVAAIFGLVVSAWVAGRQVFRDLAELDDGPNRR